MGRAGGLLLLLLAQDLGPAYVDEDHKYSVRPPAGWTRKAAAAGAVSFTPPERAAALTFLNITHYPSATPTPMKSFVSQAREYIQDKYKGAEILEEQEYSVAGRPAFRIVFALGDVLQVKAVVHRTNLEYYLADAQMARTDAPKFRAAVERSIASLEILPFRLTEEEQAAHGRFLEALRAGAPAAGLQGEEWHAVCLAGAKVGRQRTKLSVSGGLVAFELDITSDFGEGGKDSSVIRGSFSPDGRVQKVDVERTKENPKDRWQFRASGSIEGGRARVTRDMNGHKEEASFEVDPGVMFDDVAAIFQRILLGAGKGTYLIRALSPFENEPGLRWVEVNAPEPMDIGGARQETYVVFARADRRRTTPYYYGTDRKMLRQGGLKESFFLQAVPKEETEKRP